MASEKEINIINKKCLKTKLYRHNTILYNSLYGRCYMVEPRVRGGGGVLPSKRLLGMCHWMGSHFQNWTNYDGVTFLVELLERGRTFSGFLG